MGQTNTALSRRGAFAAALGAVGGLALTGQASAQLNDNDTLLLSLVSRYHATKVALVPFERGPFPKFGTPESRIYEDQLTTLTGELRDLLGALADTPARTHAGRREKALILLADLPTASDAYDLNPTSEEIRLALSVAQDAARGLLP